MKGTILTLGLAVSLLVTGGDLRAQEGDAGDAADAANAPHLPADSMEIGARYVGWFLDGEADSLWAHMTPDAQENAESVDGILNAMDQVMTQVGVQADVIETKYVMRNGMPQYWHTASFTDFDEPIQIRWVITPDGMIGGMGINPESRAPEVDPPGGPAPAPAEPAEAPEDTAEPAEAPPAPESP